MLSIKKGFPCWEAFFDFSRDSSGNPGLARRNFIDIFLRQCGIPDCNG